MTRLYILGIVLIFIFAGIIVSSPRINFAREYTCVSYGESRAIPIQNIPGKYARLEIQLLDFPEPTFSSISIPEQLICKNDTLMVIWCKNADGKLIQTRKKI